MAIWQYDLLLRSKLGSNWKKEKIEDTLNMLKKHYPECASWSKKLKILGKEDSTCLLVFICDDEITELEVRLDLRNLTKKSFTLITRCINELDAVIILDDDAEIEFSEQWLIASINDSNALKVVKDPMDFFDRLE